MTKGFYVVDILSEDADDDIIAIHGGPSGKAYQDSLRYPYLRKVVQDDRDSFHHGLFMVSMENPDVFFAAKDFMYAFVMTSLRIEEYQP